MPERGVTQVMSQRDGFGEILIEVQRPGDGASDLRNLEGMGEPGYIVIPWGGDEDLSLVLEAAKRLRVNDAVSVTLKLGAHRARFFGTIPLRQLALCRIKGKAFLPPLQPQANGIAIHIWILFNYTTIPSSEDRDR
ncbi:MAG: hypothetical protein DDT27_01655 [Dehalococcoidia bacterium]|nr:hypothetical protein [Chloroflexota bacterium]MBT9163086.1 hypothetical protein [Chloroflexota bacterium]